MSASRFRIRFVSLVVHGFLLVVSQYRLPVALHSKTLSEPDVPSESIRLPINTSRQASTQLPLIAIKSVILPGTAIRPPESHLLTLRIRPVGHTQFLTIGLDD